LKETIVTIETIHFTNDLTDTNMAAIRSQHNPETAKKIELLSEKQFNRKGWVGGERDPRPD
jgi:hypothetical protein